MWKLPDTFMDSQLSREAITLIERIENCRQQQEEIDNVYKDLCETYSKEMNKWFKHTNVHPGAKKKLRRSMKPFWNEKLHELWVILCNWEKLFLKSTGNQRAETRHDFKMAQNKFDREYRKAERKYKWNKQVEIETVNTSDPRKFWQTLKELGPRKKSNIPFEVYVNEENSELSNSLRDILNKWKCEFEHLYTFIPETGDFDDIFYTQMLKEKNRRGKWWLFEWFES